MVWGSKGTRVWQLLMVQESAMMYVDEKNHLGGKALPTISSFGATFQDFPTQFMLQQLASKIKSSPWKLKIEAKQWRFGRCLFPFQKLGEFLRFTWRFFHDVPCSKYFRSFHGTAMGFFSGKNWWCHPGCCEPNKAGRYTPFWPGVNLRNFCWFVVVFWTWNQTNFNISELTLHIHPWKQTNMSNGKITPFLIGDTCSNGAIFHYRVRFRGGVCFASSLGRAERLVHSGSHEGEMFKGPYR